MGEHCFSCSCPCIFVSVIAVFENILSYSIDRKGWSRKKASCSKYGGNDSAFPFRQYLDFQRKLSGIQFPLGAGSNIMDLEDFYCFQQYPFLLAL